jgi:hypothetical protein
MHRARLFASAGVVIATDGADRFFSGGAMRFAIRVFVAAGLLTGVTTHADASTITISATSNIFSAGESSTAGMDPAGGGPGTLPPSFSFAPGAGLSITFSSVTGLTNCCLIGGQTGPDGLGGFFTSTNINAFSGVSGIQGPGDMFLVGLFTDGTDYDGAPPATLNFSTGAGTAFTSISPLLWQQFFIGDGLTGNGSGSVQIFNVPTGATTLFLGFSDANGLSGNPGFYGDNTGSLTATFALSTPNVSAVPEPATLGLLGIGLAALAVRRLRR